MNSWTEEARRRLERVFLSAPIPRVASNTVIHNRRMHQAERIKQAMQKLYNSKEDGPRPLDSDSTFEPGVNWPGVKNAPEETEPPLRDADISGPRLAKITSWLNRNAGPLALKTIDFNLPEHLLLAYIRSHVPKDGLHLNITSPEWREFLLHSEKHQGIFLYVSPTRSPNVSLWFLNLIQKGILPKMEGWTSAPYSIEIWKSHRRVPPHLFPTTSNSAMNSTNSSL